MRKVTVSVVLVGALALSACADSGHNTADSPAADGGATPADSAADDQGADDPGASEAQQGGTELPDSPVVNGELDLGILDQLTDAAVITSERQISLLQIDPDTREPLNPDHWTESFHDFDAGISWHRDHVGDQVVSEAAWVQDPDGLSRYFQLQGDQWVQIHETQVPEEDMDFESEFVDGKIIDEAARIFDLTWTEADGSLSRAEITYDDQWRNVRMDTYVDGPEGTGMMGRTEFDRFNEEFDMPELPE